MSGKFTERFGASSPDTRNMDTLMRQAKALRCKPLTPQYIEFVAGNMERIAEDYFIIFQKMYEARKELMDIRDNIDGFFRKEEE
jgi:hypothetical protein